jgi:hypothetical protein
MTQPARDASNWWVKKRGRGVGVGSRVGGGSGVVVAGMGVGGGNVAVGDGKSSGVGVADWQAVIRRRHPIRMNFSMALLITQMSSLSAGHLWGIFMLN